jgi:hypothetical protein
LQSPAVNLEEYETHNSSAAAKMQIKFRKMPINSYDFTTDTFIENKEPILKFGFVEL